MRGPFLAVFFAGLAIVIVLLLRILLLKIIPVDEEIAATQRAPSLLHVFSSLQGLLLGFIITSLWGHAQLLDHAASNEANAIADIANLIVYLPPKEAESIRAGITNYVDVVLHVEFPRLQAGLRQGREADATLTQLRHDVFVQATADTANAMVENMIVDRLGILDNEHRQRLFDARRQLPELVWVILLVGAVVIVCGASIVSVRYQRSGTFLVAAVAAMLTLLLFTVRALERPYRSELIPGLTQYQATAQELLIRHHASKVSR